MAKKGSAELADAGSGVVLLVPMLRSMRSAIPK